MLLVRGLCALGWCYSYSSLINQAEHPNVVTFSQCLFLYSSHKRPQGEIHQQHSSALLLTGRERAFKPVVCGISGWMTGCRFPQPEQRAVGGGGNEAAPCAQTLGEDKGSGLSAALAVLAAGADAFLTIQSRRLSQFISINARVPVFSFPSPSL